MGPSAHHAHEAAEDTTSSSVTAAVDVLAFRPL